MCWVTCTYSHTQCIDTVIIVIDDKCHWNLREFKVNCPLKLDSYSDCVGKNVDIDTVCM